MIQFYGSYTIQILAIDENFHNFLTNSEYPEKRGGINGGIGVFASVSGETYHLNIVKK